MREVLSLTQSFTFELAKSKGVSKVGPPDLDSLMCRNLQVQEKDVDSIFS